MWWHHCGVSTKCNLNTFVNNVENWEKGLWHVSNGVKKNSNIIGIFCWSWFSKNDWNSEICWSFKIKWRLEKWNVAHSGESQDGRIKNCLNSTLQWYLWVNKNILVIIKNHLNWMIFGGYLNDKYIIHILIYMYNFFFTIMVWMFWKYEDTFRQGRSYSPRAVLFLLWIYMYLYLNSYLLNIHAIIIYHTKVTSNVKEDFSYTPCKACLQLSGFSA